MPLFRREFKGAAGAEAKRIAEMKEKALGSPVLGKQDSRVRASKYLALAMAGAIALGVGHKAVQNYHEQMRAKQAVIQLAEEASNRERVEKLRVAGMSPERAKYWSDYVKRNEDMVKKWSHPMIQPLSPPEVVELDKWVKNVGWGGRQEADPVAVHMVMDVIKAMHPNAKTPKEFEYERQSFLNALNYLTIGKDNWQIRDMQSLFQYMHDNNHRPEFRELLLKLRDYANFDTYPFAAH